MAEAAGLFALHWRSYFNKAHTYLPACLWQFMRALFVFGCLACSPSKKCCCCLLTKFGLAQFTPSYRKWTDKRRFAFNIFDALPMHTFAAAYSGPINTTGHDSSL
jgi:hypothetical protein